MTDLFPVTLVTGFGSGTGAAAAGQLRARGGRVAVTGLAAERLRRFAKDVGDPPELLTLPGDASDHEAVEAAVQATLTAYGRLDAVVANAGFATHDDLATGDPAGWRDMVLTNVLGPALLIRSSLAALRETRGRIVIVGSVAGFVYGAGNIYGITKWAMTGLAENTRRMVTGDGVGVTLVAPGRTDSLFWDGRGGAPEGMEMMTSDQVAESIVWALGQPAGVDVNTVVMRPIGQPV
ncbi:SDR family oxidoreductase [Streptomyces synnematoformans]|uniref:SDR family oxidoreductase n=1 Tax=Streptomyces synnematoformans TaxID=415721 RepID=A0ABN2YRA7_9ACTN